MHIKWEKAIIIAQICQQQMKWNLSKLINFRNDESCNGRKI